MSVIDDKVSRNLLSEDSQNSNVLLATDPAGGVVATSTNTETPRMLGDEWQVYIFDET